MKLTLYTEDFFNAAHSLSDYVGKCASVHGHTWKVCLWIRGDESEIAPNGLLWDFGNIKKVKNELDHKNLNDILDFNPTVENLSLYLYKKLKKESPALEFTIRIYENALSKNSYCELGDFNV